MTSWPSISSEHREAWESALVDWLANLRAGHTRRAYLVAWRNFLEVCQCDPATATPTDILRYRHHLETTPTPRTGQLASQATINQHLSALASFYTLAVKRGLRADNPCDGIKRKSVSPYGKATWLDGEKNQDVILLKAVDTSTLRGQRDLAILLLMLTLGLRISAVSALRVSDLRWQGDTAYLTFTNKGGASLERALPPVTARAIGQYLQQRGPAPADAPLFVAYPHNHPLPSSGDDIAVSYPERPLSTRAIHQMVRAIADKAFGADHGITPHSLRHTAAMNAVMEGATMTEVSQLLLHKSMQITTIYLHATERAGERASQRLGDRYAQHLPQLADRS